MRKSKTHFGIVQDDAGHILGRYKVEGRDLLRTEMAIVRSFLCGIYGEQKPKESTDPMSKVESCNIVALAGVIQLIKINEDGVFFLVDPGGETKFVPCTIHKEPELSTKLERFQKGDQIKLSGMIRAWAQKKNDVWNNHVEVRVVAIKNEPPKRATSFPREVENR